MTQQLDQDKIRRLESNAKFNEKQLAKAKDEIEQLKQKIDL